jgi:hypothetical protein
MITFKVNFQGLFAVVRHTTPPARGQGSSSTAEPMTLLFPTDTGGLPGFLARRAGEHGSGHAAGGGHGAHEPLLYVPEALVRSTPGAFKPLRPVGHEHESGFVAFSLKGWILRLPMSSRQEPVEHTADQPFPLEEPTPATACQLVGPNADWSPLTRLATLNHVTGSTLGVNMKEPDAKVIDAAVRLSGGRLECVRSYKALRDAFFEFFTDTTTVAIQPAAEDVVFSLPASSGAITLGLSTIQMPSAVVETKVILTEDTTLKVISLPPKGAPKATNLNHFFNYYPIMKNGGAAPFLRVLGRCDGTSLVHTMPGINSMDFETYHQPKIRTDENCSCLTAQVYTEEEAD